MERSAVGRFPGKRPFQLWLDDEKYVRFAEVAAAEHRSMAGQLRVMIEAAIKAADEAAA